MAEGDFIEGDITRIESKEVTNRLIKFSVFGKDDRECLKYIQG
jgi:hypothetical protein